MVTAADPILRLPRRTTVSEIDGEPNVAQVSADSVFSGWGGWGQGWNGADYSPDRGYVYWPQDDTRRDLPTFSLWEMRRRSRYLDANVGFVGRINRGIARMVAGKGLMVRPTTRDAEWNRLRIERFKQRNCTRAMDLGRKWNFLTMQAGVLEVANVDGDMGAILTRTPSSMGGLSFIEAHRIGNGRLGPGEADRMIDGVMTNESNAPLFYRVLGDRNTQVDVPAESFCYIGDPGRPGRQRTPPRCHRAINHLLDRTEIDRHFKKAIKNSSRIGFYIGTDTTQTKKPGLPVGPVDRTTQRTTPSGKRVNVDQVLDGSGGEIPEVDPGQEIKTLLDARPHPNTLGFYEYLMRDISWGTDWPPEILWNIAALGNQGTRYVMAEAQSLVDVGQQGLVDDLLTRYYLWDTRMEIAAGLLPECPDPQWWKHEWLPPMRWTIDRSKDGKLHLEQVRSGALTFRRMQGWESLDSELEMNEWMDEMAAFAAAAKARGLDVQQTLNRIYGRPGTDNAVAAEEKADPAGGEDAKASGGGEGSSS